VGPPPRITVQPRSAITTGCDVTLSVTVEAGDGPIAYRWIRDGDPAPGGISPTYIPCPFVPPATVVACTVLNAFGSVTSSNATVGYLEFALEDLVPPTLQLDVPRPTGSAVLVTNQTILLAGEVGDNRGVASVFVVRPGGGILAAVLVTNHWTAEVVLPFGRHVLECFAMDWAGNVSSTQTVEVYRPGYVEMSLDIHGSGKVVGLTNGQPVLTGSRIEATALAAPGWRFVSWTDPTGTVLGKRRSILLKPVEPVALVANFVEDSYFDGLRGSYRALFFDQENPNATNVGSFRLTVGSHGRYSAAIKIGARSMRFSGGLEVDWSSAVRLKPQPGRELLLFFRLADDQLHLTGFVSDGVMEAGLAGVRTIRAGDGVAAGWAGQYPLRSGGHALDLIVRPSGRYVARGVLEEGTRVLESGLMGVTGTAGIHDLIYGRRGALIGWLNPSSTNRAIYGRLLWSRGQSQSEDGFSAWLDFNTVEEAPLGAAP
jgi:hypothetical protein